MDARGERTAPERTHPPRRRALLLALGVGLGMSLLMFLAPGGRITLAAFTDAANVTGTTFSSYTVPQPSVTACAATSAAGSAGTNSSRFATITWTGITSPSTTYATTASANLTTISTTQAGTTTKTFEVNYNPGLAGNGNKNQTVVVTIAPSLGGTLWTGPDAYAKFRTASNNAAPTCDSVPGDSTAPTLAFKAPDTTTRTASAMQSYISGAGACGNNSKPVCGTMSDASTIASVDYIFQRVQSGNTQCWDGSAWASDCTTWQPGVVASQTVWNLTGSKTTVYATPGGSFSVQVRATDMWGNQSSPISESFTVTP